MHRQLLLQKLERYKPENAADQQHQLEIIDFIESNPNCFSRELISGHITGSAWILNKEKNKALLTHHIKLEKWVQLGGHSDSNPDTLDVAYREAQEESGLKSVIALSPEIFDIDIHTIPARPRAANDQSNHGHEHIHYDIRFLFTADENEVIQKQESESKEVRWFPLEEIANLNDSESLLRLVRKTYKI